MTLPSCVTSAFPNIVSWYVKTILDKNVLGVSVPHSPLLQLRLEAGGSNTQDINKVRGTIV